MTYKPMTQAEREADNRAKDAERRETVRRDLIGEATARAAAAAEAGDEAAVVRAADYLLYLTKHR